MGIDLYKGGCLEVMDELIEQGVKVDAIITDPPYKIITGGRNNGNNSLRPSGILLENKELMNTVPKFNEWLRRCYDISKYNSHQYFMTNFINLSKLMEAVTGAGFKIHNLLVWEKNNCTPSQYYMKNCEYIVFSRKGKAKYINNIGDSKTVHKFNNILGSKIHPTQKPIDLMEFYIKNSTNINDIVLDPFVGSGSTMVGCVNTGRRGIGIDNGVCERKGKLYGKSWVEVTQMRLDNLLK